jgi:hypothetical protein
MSLSLFISFICGKSKIADTRITRDTPAHLDDWENSKTFVNGVNR